MATLHPPRLHADEHPHLSSLAHAFWALCGAIVILYIFFAALGAIDPTEAVELTVVVLTLAALWLAHAWRDLWRDERRQA
jgi:TRAP-type C4-dicarboxylate transport system permease large subunit